MPYSEAKAKHAVQFIQQLKHTKGRWAGMPFKLLPWELELINRLFGTLREDGTRQYHTAYVEIPKKSGKSELGAAIALYMLMADGEANAEVYSAACDRQQASIVFNHGQRRRGLPYRYRLLFYRQRWDFDSGKCRRDGCEAAVLPFGGADEDARPEQRPE